MVSLAHKAGKNQSPLEKSITKVWRVPDWLPATRYDQLEGRHIPLNFTIGQQRKYCNYRNRQQSIRGGAPKPLARQGGNAEYKALLMDVAEKLGHVINGKPDLQLGTLGSIKHTDHPELWQHWFKQVATPKNRPKGVAINPEDFPYPQHICGFRRIAPLMRAPQLGPLTAEDIQWQRWGVAKLLCILTVPGWYKTILLKHCISIDPQPSWEGITFHDNVEDDECARFLAKRGLTLDEADDCLDFAFIWIQENNTPEEKEMQLWILFSQTVTMANAQPTVDPWREPVLHRFNETHAGWVPIVPPPL